MMLGRDIPRIQPQGRRDGTSSPGAAEPRTRAALEKAWMIPLSPWRLQGRDPAPAPRKRMGRLLLPRNGDVPPWDEAEDHLISKDWMNTKCSSWRGQDLETWVVPDGFLHRHTVLSRCEGE